MLVLSFAGLLPEAMRLQNCGTTLNAHIGTINLLLARHGLDMLGVATEQSGKNQEDLEKSSKLSPL